MLLGAGTAAWAHAPQAAGDERQEQWRRGGRGAEEEGKDVGERCSFKEGGGAFMGLQELRPHLVRCFCYFLNFLFYFIVGAPTET